MSTALCALIAVLFLFGVTLGMLTVLVLGIRTDDRRRNLRGAPRTRAESASRCLLLGVRNPDPGNTAKPGRTNAPYQAAFGRKTLPLRRAPRQHSEEVP